MDCGDLVDGSEPLSDPCRTGCQAGSDQAFVLEGRDQGFACFRFAEVFVRDHRGFQKGSRIEPLRMSTDIVDDSMRPVQDLGQFSHAYDFYLCPPSTTGSVSSSQETANSIPAQR